MRVLERRDAAGNLTGTIEILKEGAPPPAWAPEYFKGQRVFDSGVEIPAEDIRFEVNKAAALRQARSQKPDINTACDVLLDLVDSVKSGAGLTKAAVDFAEAERARRQTVATIESAKSLTDLEAVAKTQMEATK